MDAPPKKELVIQRPMVNYKAQTLRDPFKTLILPKVTEDSPLPVATQEEEPLPDLSKFVVQGIIWGGRIPQALINNQVYTVGDTLEGGEIITIEKGEITLRFSGRVVNLSAPGAKSSQGASKVDRPISRTTAINSSQSRRSR